MDIYESNIPQFSIHIIGNNGTVNLDFVERNYKLDLNEILLGQASDFPIKKDVTDTIGFGDKIIKGMAFFEQEYTVYAGTPQFFDIKAWIEQVFDEGISVYNSGVSFLMDLYTRFNHYYDGGDGITFFHYSGSMHQRGAFTVYKPNISGAQYVTQGINWFHRQGVWVKYDSSRYMYESILNTGELGATAFNTTLVNTALPVSLKLSMDNRLGNETGFSALPNYKANTLLRLRAYEYSMDDHSIEVVKP